MNVAGLAAQLHNNLQDLMFALEYDEQGVHQHIPERVKQALCGLFSNIQMLNLQVKDEV